MTTITLDRRALRQLIESDPEFKLSLKGAVLSEIGARYFEKDLRRLVAAAEPEMFAKALAALQQDEDVSAAVGRALSEAVVKRDSWHWSGTLTDSMRKLIADEVKRVVDRTVSDAVTTYGAEIADRVHRHLQGLSVDDRVERRVARLTDEYVNARVKAEFDRRVAELGKVS